MNHIRLKNLRWNECQPGTVYRVPVHICKEDGGGMSVFATNLPGAASQGDTIEECLANITDALAALLLSYRDHNQPVPWDHAATVPPFSEQRWVVVDLRKQQ